MIKNNFQVVELLDIDTALDPRIDSVTASCVNPNYLFDKATGAVATCPLSLEVVITPGQLVNSVSFFGLIASTINITVVDSSVEVYNKDFSLSDLNEIFGFYDWYFSPLVNKNQLATVDLPPYPNATITVTIENDGSEIECSEITFGRAKILGDTIFGTGISSKSYGIKEVDDTTGAVTLASGILQKKRDFVVTIDTPKLPYVYKILDSLDGKEAVFIGDSTFEELIIFGFHRSYSLLMSNPSTSELLIYTEEIKA